jgi:hypothetical protein
MAKPKKVIEEDVKEDIQQEIVEKPVKQPKKDKVDPEIAKLKEIAELEGEMEKKRKELYDIRVEKRQHVKQASVHECLKIAMRDDKNSEKKKLEKIVKAGEAQLKRMK